MTLERLGHGMQIALVGGVFAAGFVCGSLGRGRADAQLKEMGGAVMKQAGEQGGALGSVSQLATAIGDMQQHVDGLQKNIETLKQVKTAIGG
jgi:hypothetical protein